MFATHDGGAPVLVIGTPTLTESYALALARRGRLAIQVNGAMAALAGLVPWAETGMRQTSRFSSLRLRW